MDFNSFNDDFVRLPPILTEDIDLFLSELNILFSVEKGTIFGNRTFGHSIEHLLWKTSYNEEFITSDIQNQIEEHCLMHHYFEYDVNFTVAVGSNRDIGQLSITIRRPDSSLIIANPQWIFK